MRGLPYENGHLGQTLGIDCYGGHKLVSLATLWSLSHPLVAARDVKQKRIFETGSFPQTDPVFSK